MTSQNESAKTDGLSAQTFAQRVITLCQSQPGMLLICALFTFALMYNYIFPLGSLLFTTGIKGQDCGQMIWNLWFANEAITSGHSPFSTNLIFYPLGANLGHHTLAAGFFPLTFLIKKLSGNDPLYPFYAFKIIILFSFTMILWLSYLTLRELGLSRWSALIPAIAYAFSDFYLLHLIHINHLAGFFIPLTALFLIRAYKRPASLNLMMAALAAACSVYFTEFSIYICMALLLIVIVASLFKSSRNELVVRIKETGSRRVLTSAIIFLLIVAPFSINLFRDKIVNPPPDEPSHYSANLIGFFIPGQERDQAELYGAPYTTPLYGRAFAAVDSRITVGIGGFEIFVGFPLLIFAVAALIRSRQKFVWLCLCGAIVFFALSLGPTLKIFGADTGMPMPYSLLMKIPPFDTGRTPVRFVVMGLFFLMIVAAFGIAQTETFLAARRGRRWSCLAMMLLCVWTIAEVHSPTQRRSPFVPPAGLAKLTAGSVLNLPPVQWDGYAALLQTFHRQPIATGYLARNNVAQWTQFAAFKTAFDKGGVDFCAYVKGKGFANVVIAPDSVTMPYHFSMAPLELSHCAVNVVDLRERGSGQFGLIGTDGSEQPNSYPLYTIGSPLRFRSAEVDKYLWYGWSGREVLSHWTDRGKATIVFSLGLGVGDGQKTLRIFGAPFLAPGKLDTQRVIIMLNDQQLGSWSLNSAEPQDRSLKIPAGLIRDHNVLMLIVPDAASPKSLSVSEDVRLLGFNVQWIEID
jgi:hypothetical protein